MTRFLNATCKKITEVITDLYCKHIYKQTMYIFPANGRRCNNRADSGSMLTVFVNTEPVSARSKLTPACLQGSVSG